MFDGLFIASLIGSCFRIIKEACERPIPAENWANKDLYYQDMLNGVSAKQRMKNVENGKYKLVENYPEPHRNTDGKIVIENCKLFNEDKKKYGVAQAYKWIKQGRYNLTPEELEKEREHFRKEYNEWLDKTVKLSMSQKGLQYKHPNS